MIEISADEFECTECGAWIPEDAGNVNPSHDEDCERYQRVETEADAAAEYRDLLDEIYEPVKVCGYTYDAGRALQSLDPVAFRQGLLDYCDTHGIEII